MRKLLCLLALAAGAFAQTASYPGAVVTDSQLRVAVNNCQTTLTFPMLSSDTHFSVANASCIATGTVATIDNEKIAVCNVVGNVVSVGKSSCENVDGRAFDNTSAAAHANGATAALNTDAWFHNAMKAEVEAMETALGANLANLPAALPSATGQLQYLRTKPNTGNNTTLQFSALPTSLAADYNFPAQTPGGTLSPGSNTIAMSPCPLGVNGTDVFHKLYLSNGTGTAEAAVITGGTCTSGASSGTVIVTAANSHSSTWTIGSATSGIQEAIVLVKAAGFGRIMIAGAQTVRASIVLPNGTPITLAGDGIGSTTLTLANGVNADLLTNENFSTLTGSGSMAGIYQVTIKDLTLDGNKTNQSGTSWCLRIFGHAYTLEHVQAQNGLTGGIYSEYGNNQSFTSPATDLETSWHHVRSEYSSGTGIQFKGPGDSYMEDIVSFQHAGWCFQNQASGITYGGSIHITDMDTYICGTGSAGGDSNPGGCYTNGPFIGASIVCASALGPGLFIDANTAPILLSHPAIATSDVNASGLILTGAGQTIVGGEINGGKYGITFGAGGAADNSIVGVQMTCPGTACVNFSNTDAGFNFISATGILSNGAKLYAGTPSTNDSLHLFTYNPGSTYSGTQQYFNRELTQSTWNHYHVVKTAGNWVINGGTGVAAAAATTQSLTLDATGVGAFVDAARLQTAVAFTGVTTAVVSGLGNSGNITNYYSGSYDLKAAVASTNLADIRPSSSASTNGSQALQFQITTTVGNVSAIADGAALDIWVKWGVLQ